MLANARVCGANPGWATVHIHPRACAWGDIISMPEEPDQSTSEVMRRRALRHHPIAAQREQNALLRKQAERIAQSVNRPEGELPIYVAMVPANTRETTALPKETRQRFLDRLETIVRRVFIASPTATPVGVPSADPTASAMSSPDESVDSPAVAAILGGSCATCRGECCTAGGDHAFLREDSIERVRGEQPSLDPAAMLAQYADHLPERHYRGSCVYHGLNGCHLPRDLRSNLCNRYVCGGLTQLRSALSGNASPTAFVAAADSVHLRRMALVDASETRSVALN